MVSNLTSGIYKFQLTVTDTIGQSDSTKVTILVLTPEQSEREYLDWGRRWLKPQRDLHIFIYTRHLFYSVFLGMHGKHFHPVDYDINISLPIRACKFKSNIKSG